MTQGNFPVNDLAFDVISIVYQKSKALEVYEKYMQDAQNDQKLKDLLKQISQEDREHVRQLRDCLGDLLNKGKAS